MTDQSKSLPAGPTATSATSLCNVQPLPPKRPGSHEPKLLASNAAGGYAHPRWTAFAPIRLEMAQKLQMAGILIIDPSPVGMAIVSYIFPYLPFLDSWSWNHGWYIRYIYI